MGIVEEGGKAASGYITALGSQPVLLVQSLIIAGVVFILYAQGSKSFTEREQLLKSVFDAQTHVREILSQCIIPQDRRGSLQKNNGKSPVFKLQSEESKPFNLPKENSGVGVPGQAGSPSGPAVERPEQDVQSDETHPLLPKEGNNVPGGSSLEWVPMKRQVAP